MENKYILSIDIGGTSIKIGVISGCDVVESISLRNIFKGKSHLFIDGIKEICNNYLKKYDVSIIGVGCPGDIIDGVVRFASNLGWKNYNILEAIKDAFPTCQVFVDNDGHSACKAEIEFGKLKGIKDAIFVTIGRGVGGTIIKDYKIECGSNNMAGRFGHMIISSYGRKCNCGQFGCYETYASVVGLINTVKEFNRHEKNKKYSIDKDLEKLSGKVIVKHINNNNIMVKKAVNKWNEDIAIGLLNLCHLIDPSLIVIAGGITESGLLDIDFINSYLKKYKIENCKVECASFKGKTGLVGASLNCVNFENNSNN